MAVVDDLIEDLTALVTGHCQMSEWSPSMRYLARRTQGVAKGTKTGLSPLTPRCDRLRLRDRAGSVEVVEGARISLLLLSAADRRASGVSIRVRPTVLGISRHIGCMYNAWTTTSVPAGGNWRPGTRCGVASFDGDDSSVEGFHAHRSGRIERHEDSDLISELGRRYVAHHTWGDYRPVKWSPLEV